MATLSEKLPNCTYFYQNLTQEEIDSIVIQKYYDPETGTIGTIAEVPELAKKQYISIGMNFE